jgi:hypothetical protein
MTEHKKFGTAQTRRIAARIVRNGRSRFPHLLGGWTRTEWNYQVRLAGRTFIAKHQPTLQHEDHPTC